MHVISWLRGCWASGVRSPGATEAAPSNRPCVAGPRCGNAVHPAPLTTVVRSTPRAVRSRPYALRSAHRPALGPPGSVLPSSGSCHSHQPLVRQTRPGTPSMAAAPDKAATKAGTDRQASGAQHFMRALLIELTAKLVKAPLLRSHISLRRSRFLLHRPMHPLTPPVC